MSASIQTGRVSAPGLSFVALALLATSLAACGSISSGTDASGAAGTTGSGGTTGSAGTTGSGGTTGSAGTTGAAGTTGSAGTTGAGGGGGTVAGRGGSGGGGRAGSSATGNGGRGGGSGGTTGVGGSAAAGTTGRAGSSGAAGRGGASGGQGGASGAGGSGTCTLPCAAQRFCCGNACVNEQNDPMNCGKCGNRCEGATPLCSGGVCMAPPCSNTAGICAPNSLCCGNTCCASGDLCCQVDGPVSGGPPTCFTPTAAAPTCPQGCAPLCVSDRNQKKNIAPADPAAILDKVSRLPISTWTYRSEPADVRHLGPMAQDFRASFGLGNDDRTYFAVDAQGVALAAIQALDRLVADQKSQIEKLERQNQDLARRLLALESGGESARRDRRGGAR